jgi:hypothetical protein
LGEHVSQGNTIFVEDVNVPADYIISRNISSRVTDLEMTIYAECRAAYNYIQKSNNQNG